MTKIIIGVTGVNAVDNPGPGIGVIRSLKEDKDLQVTAIGLPYDAMEPGVYMDWLVDRSYIMPYPSGNEGDVLSRMEYIQAQTNLNMLTPTLDSELPLFIGAKSKLDQMGINTFLPTRKQYDLRDKRNLAHVAKKINIKLPETRSVTTYQELAAAFDEIQPPVMIKGLFYKAFMAHTLQEAMGYFDSVANQWGFPILVQQVVGGEEMNVVGLGDGKGANLGLVAIKKLTKTSLGKIWTGVTIKNKGVLDAARDFVEAYKWKGGFELECMVSGQDIHLIEINPRFPAWIYFATGVGINLPARLVRAALDLPQNQNMDYQTGKLYVRYTYDIVTDMTAFQSLSTEAET